MRKIFFALVICFVVAGFSHSAYAATFNFTVDSTLDTSDANPGDGTCATSGSVCTLRAAIEEATSTTGNIYNITISGALNGQTTSPLSAYPALENETVSIIGPGIDNFTIDAAAIVGQGVITLDNVDGGTFSGFAIINVDWTGFQIENGSNNNIFTDFGVHGTGLDTGHALVQLLQSTGNTISECELSQGGLGVRVEDHSDHTLVENCVSDSQQHSGLTLFDSDFNTFRGNTIANSDEKGMFIIFGASNNLIENNTITNSVEMGIIIGGSVGSDLETTNMNVFRGNTISGTVEEGGIFITSNTDHTTFVGNTIINNAVPGILTINGGTNINNITIGGTNPGDGNIISGNGGDAGVYLFSGNLIMIQGNSIGLSSDGTTSLPNSGAGILVTGASDVTIGGTVAGSRNYIASNIGANVGISETASDIIVEGNYIGLDTNGNPVGSSEMGIAVTDTASGVVIGGSDPDAGNVISGMQFGLFIISDNPTVIQGNKIGTSPIGAVVAGYGNQLGIYVGTQNNLIGGVIAGEGNIIAGNGVGVGIISNGTTGPIGNSVLGNSIFLNTDIGINHVALDGNGDPIFGQNVNDYQDGDIGPNGYLNHPVLLAGTQVGSDISLRYMLDVAPGTYRLEFFTNQNQISQVGFGQGETYEDYENITVSSSGPQIMPIVTVNNAVLDYGLTVTLTECSSGCTSFGSTSEFSNIITSTSGGIDRGTAVGDETDLIDNGAYHVLSGSYLGSCVNTDTDTSDDADGPSGCGDDRNGVDFSADSYAANETISFVINPTDNGFINVFLDTDQNGRFDDADGWLFNNRVVSAGPQSLNLPINPGLGTYNIRFRYTTYNPDNLTGTGEALDGEVEDYTLTIITVAVPSASGSIAQSVSGGCPASWVNHQGNCIQPKSVAEILGSGTCPAYLIIHDFMKQGDRNGKYSAYNKSAIKEVGILQAHINRILAVQYQQAAGPVDGIFGKLTKRGVERLQVALNQVLKPVPILKVDGIVGPFTREAINRSCG